MKKFREKLRYIIRRIGKRACSVLLVLALLLGCASYGILKENKTSRAFFVVDDLTVLGSLMSLAIGGMIGGASYNQMVTTPEEQGIDLTDTSSISNYIESCFSKNPYFHKCFTDIDVVDNYINSEIVRAFEHAIEDYAVNKNPRALFLPRKETFDKIWKVISEGKVDGTSALKFDESLRQVKSATIYKFPNQNEDDEDDEDDEEHTSEDLGEEVENAPDILPSFFLDLVPSLALTCLIAKAVSYLISLEGNIEKRPDVDGDPWSGCDWTLGYFKEHPDIWSFTNTYTYNFQPKFKMSTLQFNWNYRGPDYKYTFFTDEKLEKYKDMKIIPIFYCNGYKTSSSGLAVKFLVDKEIDLNDCSFPNGQFYPIMKEIHGEIANGYTLPLTWVNGSSRDNDLQWNNPFEKFVGLSNCFQNDSRVFEVRTRGGVSLGYLNRIYEIYTHYIENIWLTEHRNCFVFDSLECANAFENAIKTYGEIPNDPEVLNSIYKDSWWKYHKDYYRDPNTRDKSKDNEMISEGNGKDKTGKIKHTRGIDPAKVNDGLKNGKFNDDEISGKEPEWEHGHISADIGYISVPINGATPTAPFDPNFNVNPWGDPYYNPNTDVVPTPINDPIEENDPSGSAPPSASPSKTNAPSPSPMENDNKFPDVYPILPSGDSEGIQWYERFPFCIPFDIANTVEKLSAQAKPPSFVVPYTVKSLNYKQNVEIKLEEPTWEKIRIITKWFILIIFVVGLAILTRHIIRG